MRVKFEPAAAAIIALLAWCGVMLQLWLLLRESTDLLRTTINFFSYFTILNNTLVAAVLSVRILSRGGAARLATVGVRSAVAVYIALVGVVYSAILRALWSPTGLQAVADQLLHDVVPVLYVLYWMVFVEKGWLRFSSLSRWLVYPVVYVTFILARGAAVGWYPYHFLDVSQLGYVRVLVNAVGLLCALLALGTVVIGIDKVAGARMLPGRGR